LQGAIDNTIPEQAKEQAVEPQAELDAASLNEFGKNMTPAATMAFPVAPQAAYNTEYVEPAFSSEVATANNGQCCGGFTTKSKVCTIL